MKELIKAYKALSDDSRLRVLNLLISRECCVCEVVQTLNISQSKASRILTILYNAGFLKLRKEGLWSLYSIDWEGMSDQFSATIKIIESTFVNNNQMLDDLKQLKSAKRLYPTCDN
jgi:ArsR family transcriptional regulator